MFAKNKIHFKPIVDPDYGWGVTSGRKYEFWGVERSGEKVDPIILRNRAGEMAIEMNELMRKDPNPSIGNLKYIQEKYLRR